MSAFFCSGEQCPGLPWPANVLDHPRTCLADPSKWPGLAARPEGPSHMGTRDQSREAANILASCKRALFRESGPPEVVSADLAHRSICMLVGDEDQQ